MKDVVEGDFLIYFKLKLIFYRMVLLFEFVCLVGYYLVEGYVCFINGCELLIFLFYSDEFEYVEDVC